MNSILNDITNYIDFLRESGFSVMLSCFNSVLNEHIPVLINYEPHLPSVCSYLKSNPDTRNKCIENKQKLNDLSPKKPYYSCCWAGIEEYVIPIVYQDALVCCINLSGYRDSLDKSKCLSEKLIDKLGNDFLMKYSQLSPLIPDTEKVQKIINPLKYMFYALYDKCLEFYDKGNAPSTTYINTIKYINEHYMQKLTIDNIAYAMNCSSSYLRHLFSQNRKTVMGHVNFIRLTRAKSLLKYTNNSITSIALDCGFDDSNYFSTVFKKSFGITPTKYRKQSMPV